MRSSSRAMHANDPIRILIADDHPIVRDGLVAIVNRRPDMEVVGQAADGQEAVALFRQHHPDIALIDLRMPRMEGVRAIEAIRAEAPDARTIILTTYEGDEDIYRGIQAGAKGYLLKDAPREEILAAIRLVYAGGTHLPSHIAAKLTRRIQSSALTEREMEVLRLVGSGKSNREIAGLLNITEGTVKLHVSHIMLKLGAADRTHAVTLALRRGILRLEPPSL